MHAFRTLLHDPELEVKVRPNTLLLRPLNLRGGTIDPEANCGVVGMPMRVEDEAARAHGPTKTKTKERCTRN